MQITSTVPVRTSFYTYSVDWERIGFEALLYLCMIFVLASQVRCLDRPVSHGYAVSFRCW
jgi:hypothetical protein